MLKAGILGGGQLGRMLLQAAANYPVQTYVLENDANCPSAHLCHHFTKGDIQDFNTVYNFGKALDLITIEIENVNIEALEKLESEGIVVIPKPSVLRIIRNKINQKKFYLENNIASPAFHVTENKQELSNQLDFLPAVHKIGEGGYDGKGVQFIKNSSDLEKGFDAPSVLEKAIEIQTEIAQMVAVGQDGSMAFYPPVEMVFDNELNLLDYQICPVSLAENIISEIKEIAKSLVSKLNSPGLFAVEFLIDKQGKPWVNETAPRVHNSGHHTIEAHFCSQFDMLWRIILNYPLGNTKAISPSILINILGAQTGNPSYLSLGEILTQPNVFVHLYGKEISKPGRKMGHINLLGNNREKLLEQAHTIKALLSKLC